MHIRLKKFALTVAVAALAVTPTLADEYIYGSWFSANHLVNSGAVTTYFELLAESTDGAVNWKLVPGAQLASGPATAEAVSDGLMDGGIAIAPYSPRLLATTNTIFSHSLLGDDTLAAAGAMNEAIMLNCEGCKAEYGALNAVSIGGYSTTPYKFMCSTEVNTVEDLVGLKVRSSGGGVNISEIAGATPVSMSPGEATSALERGTLDCVLGAVSWLRSFGYMDVVESVVDSPMGMGGPPIIMFINRDVWASMTPEMRAAHVEFAPDLVAAATYDGQVVNDDIIVAAAKEAGVNFVDSNEGFEALMIERDKQQMAINIRNAENAGVENPEELLIQYVATYEKWKALLDEQGHDRETFRRLLWEEVYSKVDAENL